LTYALGEDSLRNVLNKTRKSKLVRNENTPGHLQSFTCNLLPNQCRYETLEGREHLVVPMVILTEGVHAGSDGPLLYPKEELSKTPAAWNHKPVVVYHPELNGQGISACDPTIINNRKVGVMLNTKYEKGRLKSEAWIEKSRADIIDERIMAAVKANEMMELSTGVFVDEDKTPGKWQKEDYVAIARNYRPDHLALLPDKVGACSIADGAGFLRNEVHKDVSLNESSFGNISSTLGELLRARFSTASKSGEISGPWVQDVYSNFFIFSKDGKLWRLGYTTDDDGGVSLDKGEPTEVKRVTEYRSVAGAFVGNQNKQETKTVMTEAEQKKALVDALIGNAGWVEEDRATLQALPLKSLEKIKLPAKETIVPLPAATTTGTTAIPAAAPVGNTSQPTTAPKEPPVPITAEEYIQNAPKALRDVLTNSMALHNEEKQRLVDIITANKNNSFSKEDLNNRPLGELKSLARLAGGAEVAQRPANYAGQAPVPTGNVEAEEVLALPTMNFEKAKAA